MTPIKVLPLIRGFIAPVLKSVQKSNFINDVQTDPVKAFTGLIDQIGIRYTGISMMGNHEGIDTGQVIPTYVGLFAGVVGSKIATKFGVNRQVKRLPFIGGKFEL